MHSDGQGDQGWGDYPDARGMGSLTAAPMTYAPSLASVGSGSSYWPGDVSHDALALNFLGFIPDQIMSSVKPSTGSEAGDMAANAGAWDPTFQQGVKDFQDVNNDTVDGWIGPPTRTSLAAAVIARNLQSSPLVPPQPVTPTPPAPGVPPPGVLPSPFNPQPYTPPAPAPGAQAAATPWLMYGGIAAAALAVVGVGWWALSDG